jgi:hypothetical protein
MAVLSECDGHLGKASDYFRINIRGYGDSVSLGLLCDAGIERTDVYLRVACLFLSAPTPTANSREEGQGRYWEILEEKAAEVVDAAAKILAEIKVDFAEYKGMNAEGFARLDKKILELNAAKSRQSSPCEGLAGNLE